MDFRFLPKTNISYDQIFNYYKGDTGVTDQNQNFQLANWHAGGYWHFAQCHRQPALRGDIPGDRRHQSLYATDS